MMKKGSNDGSNNLPLPDEMIQDILVRVPAESILECKQVCKPWRNLILHPSFYQLYINHLDSAGDSGKLGFIFSSRELVGYAGEMVNKFYYAEYDENYHESHETQFSRKSMVDLNPSLDVGPELYSFVGSCRGLICLEKSFERGPSYICNPITREYITLPRFEGYYKSGFGYSHSTKEYKVVRICLHPDKSNFAIFQVYTLGSSNGWRNLGEMEWKDMDLHGCAVGVFANEALHWVNQDKNNILAFHLADEKFSELPLPPPMRKCYAILGVLGDFLSVTYSDTPDGEIWLTEENENLSCWTWSNAISYDSSGNGRFWPFGYTRSRRFLLHGGSCRSDIYIFMSDACSTFIDFGKKFYEVIRHKNTLVSLRELGEKDAKTMQSNERASSSEVIDSSAWPYKHRSE